MNSLDFLYYSAGIGILAFVTIIAFVANNLLKTLASLKILIENTDNIVRDVRSVKDTVKIGIIGKAVSLLKFVF